MNELLITYGDLGSGDLQGITQADYLVALGATLRVSDGESLVYEEPDFPVVELARELRRWLADTDRGNFEFQSMSFEEIGSVAIRRGAAGWVVTSVFAPSRSSSPQSWEIVLQSVISFIRRVESDLITLRADPGEVLGP